MHTRTFGECEHYCTAEDRVEVIAGTPTGLAAAPSSLPLRGTSPAAFADAGVAPLAVELEALLAGTVKELFADEFWEVLSGAPTAG